jgi:hypothetical protein
MTAMTAYAVRYRPGRRRAYRPLFGAPGRHRAPRTSPVAVIVNALNLTVAVASAVLIFSLPW